MKRILFYIFVLFLFTNLYGQSLSIKKCKTCGKPLSQCEYKGKHPQNENNASPQNHIHTIKGNENGYEWVDLGLPSGTKWATCNIGASSPSDYGNYYAWGEVLPKMDYLQDNYFDYAGKNGSGVAVYSLFNNTGGLRSISPSSKYDAARINWGGNWRMPTSKEYLELLENTNKTIVTINGVKGEKFESKKNHEYIFLPFAGVKYRREEHSQKGECGLYWCSDLYNGSDGANCLEMTKDFEGNTIMHLATGRYSGQSIRPVL